MMLCPIQLPETKQIHVVTDSQCKHDSLHARRVMERWSLKCITPVTQRSPCVLHKSLGRIPLHNSCCQAVKLRIGDNQRSFLHGAAAHGNIHEMNQLAKIHDNGDMHTIEMTKALGFPRALMKNVAVHEGNCGFAANKLLKTDCLGIVESHHHLVTIDAHTIAPVQQHATVSHHSTSIVPPPATAFVFFFTTLCCCSRGGGGGGVGFVNHLLDGGNQFLHHSGLEGSVLQHPCLQQQLELRPQGHVPGRSKKCSPIWLISSSGSEIQVVMIPAAFSFSVGPNMGSRAPASNFFNACIQQLLGFIPLLFRNRVDGDKCKQRLIAGRRPKTLLLGDRKRLQSFDLLRRVGNRRLWLLPAEELRSSQELHSNDE